MKRLAPTATADLERLSPIVWRSTGALPGLVYEMDRARGTFLCVLLHVAGDASPKVTFDQGAGFTDLSALTLKSFPLAFYHLRADHMPAGSRMKLQPCGGPTIFRLVSFQTSNGILVAVLHYLFNLRYQKIGIFGPTGPTPQTRWQRTKSDALRIFTFFKDVARGRGLRVQEGSGTWNDLKLALSLQAAELRPAVEARLGRTPTPLISFVAPTYNTRPAYLRDLVESFAQERADFAELILSDDGSTDKATLAYLRNLDVANVRVLFNPTNRGIAASTNAGVAAAGAPWVALIDHDDLFVAGATVVIADAILRCPDAIFFYTDELIVDGALKAIGDFCKPAFDSVLLSGVNYINHFSIYRRQKLHEIGGLREDREGSQDYDLVLRYLADAPIGGVVHIPFIAYMWRREEGSFSHVHLASSTTNARRALEAAHAARGQAVTLEPARDENFHRVRFAPPTSPTLVSVIIPNRDSPSLIRQVVHDVLERTDYPRLELVIVDNGTTDPETLAFYRSLDTARTTIDIVPEAFNFARICNRGARLARGDALLFLNNDIEVREPGWLAEMVECLSFPATGIVGARLLYPSGKIQHNGVIVGLGQAAGHWYIDQDPEIPGPMGRFFVRQTLSAVTAACMLVTRSCFDALDGFDAESFAISYNDIDFCLRARAAGYRTVWTPFATLVHHESVSRGSDEHGAANIRFKAEMTRLQARHGTKTLIDDAYSPFYDRRDSRPHVLVPDTLPALRPNVLP